MYLNRQFKNLRANGLDVIVHLILGLPGESTEQMVESIRYLNCQDIQGVKLQLLHILKGTELGEQFVLGTEDPFTLDEYADLLCELVRNLRPEIVIHRLTGDGAKKDLLAPLWSADKKRVLNTIRQRFHEQKVIQGSAWS